MEHLFSGKGF